MIMAIDWKSGVAILGSRGRNIVHRLIRQWAITQQVLADAVGLSRQAINEIAREKSWPQEEHRKRIADYFGLPEHVVFFAQPVTQGQHRDNDRQQQSAHKGASA